MRAVRVRNGRGDADALYINDNEPDPVPGPGQLLVSIKAFGLNRMDIMQREDRYPYPLLPESGDIMGVEFSGTVKGSGPECEPHIRPCLIHWEYTVTNYGILGRGEFHVGDEVFGLAYGSAVGTIHHPYSP